MLLNLQALTSRKHKSLMFHVAEYVGQGSLINLIETKKNVFVSQLHNSDKKFSYFHHVLVVMENPHFIPEPV